VIDGTDGTGARAGRSGDVNHAPLISEYALLGDCHCSALVSRPGSVDWWCAPRFDAPTVFGRLLDPTAGHWSIRPAGEGVAPDVRAADDLETQRDEALGVALDVGRRLNRRAS
jgi:GH15 family glucan-1,4-alpha-glucosidase